MDASGIYRLTGTFLWSLIELRLTANKEQPLTLISFLHKKQHTNYNRRTKNSINFPTNEEGVDSMYQEAEVLSDSSLLLDEDETAVKKPLDYENLKKLKVITHEILGICFNKKTVSSFQDIFSSQNIQETPIEQNVATYTYYKFLEILKIEYTESEVRCFTEKLSHVLEDSEDKKIIPTLMLFFWGRIIWKLESILSSKKPIRNFLRNIYFDSTQDSENGLNYSGSLPSCYYSAVSINNSDVAMNLPTKLLGTILKTFDETFDGNMCLSRFNRTCCNCICIVGVESFHRCFIKYCFMKHSCCRRLYEAWPKWCSTVFIWSHYIILVCCIPISGWLISNTSGLVVNINGAAKAQKILAGSIQEEANIVKFYGNSTMERQ